MTEHEELQLARAEVAFGTPGSQAKPGESAVECLIRQRKELAAEQAAIIVRAQASTAGYTQQVSAAQRERDDLRLQLRVMRSSHDEVWAHNNLLQKELEGLRAQLKSREDRVQYLEVELAEEKAKEE